MNNLVKQYFEIRKKYKELKTISKYKNVSNKSLKVLATLINELREYHLYSEIKLSLNYISLEIKVNNNLFNFTILQEAQLTNIKDNIRYYHLDKDRVYETNNCMNIKEAKDRIRKIILYIERL